MSMKNSANSGINFCMICNNSCIIENGLDVFKDQVGLGFGEDVASFLSKIINKDIKQDPDANQIICNKCFKLVQELHELQNRVSKIKDEMIDTHRGIGKTKQEVEEEKPFTKTVIEECNETNQIVNKVSMIHEADEVPINKNTDQIQMTVAEVHTAINSVVNGIDHEGKDTVVQFQNFSVKAGTILDAHLADDLGGAVIASKQQIIDNINIKTEPGTEEDVNSKMNLLKKKADTLSSETILKKDQDFYILSPVACEGNVYTCLLCQPLEKITGDSKTITAHVKGYHGLNLYICNVCGEVFQRQNLLSAHLVEHVVPEEGDFQCEVCNRIFTNIRSFRIHKHVHGKSQNKVCDFESSDKKYSQKYQLKQHIKSHLDARPYTCSICGQDFSSKYILKVHEKTHMTSSRAFSCNICSKSFLSQQQLRDHECTHMGVSELNCHLCGKMFGSKHYLEIHSIVHTGYKPYICGKCGKAFARKAEIRDHERTHTGEKPYQCEFCGTTFSQRSNLHSHKRATHYNDKRYQCQDCGRGFKRKRLLDYHIKSTHTGERPFKCEICNATFVYPEHFKKHRRIHTGEKPFLCEVCGKAFNSRDNRNAHRYSHSYKKPYECMECGTGYMRKRLLYEHMKVSGHLNDAFLVNQPRILLDDDQVITWTNDGMQVVIADRDEEEQVHNEGDIFNEAQNAPVQEIEQDEKSSFSVEADYNRIIPTNILADAETQIIDTEDGQVQLIKVRIPNENGEEEEAWIKIVPE